MLVYMNILIHESVHVYEQGHYVFILNLMPPRTFLEENEQNHKPYLVIDARKKIN